MPFFEFMLAVFSLACPFWTVTSGQTTKGVCDRCIQKNTHFLSTQPVTEARQAAARAAEPVPRASGNVPAASDGLHVLKEAYVRVAYNQRARFTQVLVFGFMYQDAILVHLFEL